MSLDDKQEAYLKETKLYPDIPSGYQCFSKIGVFMLSEDKDGNEKKIQVTTRPIIVKALSRDEENGNWGMLVWWLDMDNNEHQLAIPKKLFHANGTDIQQLLADNGLPIMIGKEKILLNYLASFNVKERLIAASCTGWLNNAFVLPSESLRQPRGNCIVYQPSGFSNISNAISKAGTLKEWQQGMANASSMIQFLVCASLAAPVRYKVGIEAGGFHIYNTTSQGKTTALQAGASVWGNGKDPGIEGGDGAYIQRWNATGNALEAVAESFNDLPLVIDEIGEGDPREFGKTIYRVISGTGKSRLKDTANLRNSRSWRVTVLSAGEMAVSAFIESGGGKVKGGQLVRIVDVDLSGLQALFTSSNEADAMKKLCAKHYGHAGIELINKVDDLTLSWDEFDFLQIGEAYTPIANRVLKRFALVAHTGIIAIRAGILPWTEKQVIESVRSAYNGWHSQISNVSDVDRGVDSVKNFILTHQSRFETNSSYPPPNRAGWLRDDIFHFTQVAFKEACNGVDAAKVKKTLKELGVLHCTKGLNSVIKINGNNSTVISVKSEILNNSTKNNGSAGSHSSKLEVARAAAATTSKSRVVAQVAQSNQATTATTKKIEVVARTDHMSHGLLPPLLSLPPENSNCNKNDDMEIF